MKWLFTADAAGAILPDGTQIAPGKALDHDFLNEHTVGINELRRDIESASWSDIVQQSGIPQEKIEALAHRFVTSKAAIACWAMGLTQNKYAVTTIQQVANLMLLRGHIGRPGAGLCPVRGHSNVQGDRTMGITPNPKPEFLAGLQRAFAFEPPREMGLDTVAAIEALHAGKAKVLLCMGGNFAAATPDSDFTEAALRNAEMTVQITTKLNRSHVVHGQEAWILPTLGRSEKDIRAGKSQKVTVEDSMSLVHASEGRLSPASPELVSEVAITCGIAAETLPIEKQFPWAQYANNYDKIRESIEQTLPIFNDFNRRIENGESFYLGNTARERQWKNGLGKAKLVAHPLPIISITQGHLRLMTIRSHDQYNTTVYGNNDRYRGVKGERRVLFMNTADLSARALHPLDSVDLISHWEDGQKRRAENFKVVAYDIPIGCAAAYFPETNVLVPIGSIADKSRTPTSKFIEISIEPSLEPK